MSYEPGIIEIFLTVVFGSLFGSMYRGYVDRLGLKGGEHVLDFGSGSGNLSRFIAPKLALGGGRLTCVDISKKWMDVARWRLGKYPNVDFKLGDIATLDIPNASRDVVVIQFVLHDIEAAERQGIARNLVPRLKDDGTLFIREPMRFISCDEIRQLMQQNGLEEIESQVTEIKTQGTVYEASFASGPKDAQPLVLLHATSASATMCFPNIADLSRNYRTFALDTVGEPDKSVVSNPPQKRSDYALWLNDVFSELNVARADVVGASYGGWMTMNLALYPDLPSFIDYI